MKKLLIILILLTMSYLSFSQDTTIKDNITIGASTPYLLIEGDTSQLFIGNPNDTIVIGGTIGNGSSTALIGDSTQTVRHIYNIPIKGGDLLEYEKYCYADTIMAIPCNNEFIINQGTYKEMVTIEQLNNRGYYYAYRWVIDTDPFEFEYYFVKKPTFKGFIEWVKKTKH